jgi:hypothetical protein
MALLSVGLGAVLFAPKMRFMVGKRAKKRQAGAGMRWFVLGVAEEAPGSCRECLPLPPPASCGHVREPMLHATLDCGPLQQRGGQLMI